MRGMSRWRDWRRWRGDRGDVGQGEREEGVTVGVHEG